MDNIIETILSHDASVIPTFVYLFPKTVISLSFLLFFFFLNMGQASSSPIKLSFFKKTTENKYEDISNKFTKATVSTLAVPMIIIAYPVLNAYTFQDSDITGVRIIDGAIGGILGVIGCNE